ncbi:class I SAM-dependent methyltransferase [Streptomyces vinaceus]|uniref:class I SAM-dependent methyltransferase n=1 Tax=Streptomyces vinaceus TaxID=1960 RepID=UPI0036961CB1
MSAAVAGGTPADGLMSTKIPQDRVEARGYMRWWDRFYGEWRKDTDPKLTRKELAQLTQRVRLEPGQTAIDVGCGRGALAVELAGLGLQVAGYDWSRVAVNSARVEHGGRGVVFRRHDFTSGTDPVGVEDGSIDLIVCRLSLQYLDADAFLADAARWLRPETGTLHLVLPVLERQSTATEFNGYPEATIEYLREGWAHSERWNLDRDRAFTALALSGPLHD